jgi:hypothetical protein
MERGMVLRFLSISLCCVTALLHSSAFTSSRGRVAEFQGSLCALSVASPKLVEPLLCFIKLQVASCLARSAYCVSVA